MTGTVSIDDVLSKFISNEVDSTEVLKLLLTSDETGIDYLQNLKKEFKEKYVTPTFNKAKDYYSKVEKKIEDTKGKKEIIDQYSDPLGIIELREEYKKKTEEILKKNLDGLNLNLNDKPQISNLSNSNISSVISNKPVNQFAEQQTLTQKTPEVSLTDETIKQLGGVLSGINEQNIKRFGRTTVKGEESSSGDGLLGTLASLLIAGGIGAMLISSFWDKHIKPWLEEKVGIKLDVFDRFEGIVEGIGKFFTMGALKIGGGWFFNLVGKAFTTFGDLLEGGLKAIFKLGFGDDVVKAGATAAPAAWKTLIPKIAGGLFRGMGAVAFKTIPIIGSLISFYYAWDRFEKGDTIAGIIDLVGGISNLLVFTPLAPLALPLSIGASALNAFLDYKAGRGATMDEKQNIKMDYVNKIVDFIQEIPIVGGLIKWGRGFWELGQGNFKEALNYLTETPFLGPFPAILQALVNSNAFGTENTGNFSFEKLNGEIKKSMFRWLCSVIPKIGGIRGRIAEAMGLNYDDESGNVKVDETPFDINQQYADMDKQNEETKKSLERNKQIAKSSIDPNTTKYSKEDEKALEEMLEKARLEHSNTLKQLEESKSKLFSESKFGTDFLSGFGFNNYYKTNNLKNSEYYAREHVKNVEQMLNEYKKFSTVKRDDFSFKSLMTSTEGNSILFDKNTNTANVLHPDDNVLAYKTGGVFDTALKELTLLVQSINKGIYKIPESLENNKSKPSNVSVVNNSGGSNGNMLDVILSGTRPDSIYNFRRSIQGEFT
jgi:hypothetical protein